MSSPTASSFIDFRVFPVDSASHMDSTKLSDERRQKDSKNLSCAGARSVRDNWSDGRMCLRTGKYIFFSVGSTEEIHFVGTHDAVHF